MQTNEKPNKQLIFLENKTDKVHLVSKKSCNFVAQIKKVINQLKTLKL